MAGVESFDLERYLSESVERIIRQICKAAAFCPRESRFLARYARAGKKAAAARRAAEARGEHIPPFLIASITTACNLHCVGCYARSISTCTDAQPVGQMTADEWARVFREARTLGVGFILLAGGEPMMRRDILQKAAEIPEILFPVITNGTLLDDAYLDLFDRRRNLVPILSIEGDAQTTDARRGAGIYQGLQTAMTRMAARRIAFGASVTVTRENLAEVTSDGFVRRMNAAGCKAILFVEFVPTEPSLRAIAPDEAVREELAARLAALRQAEPDLLLLSFPGDEKKFGGCLAAGRGFFHINARGGAEPCPFSPYSDVSVRDHSLQEVLQSKLFSALRTETIPTSPHIGGCVLYEQKEQVEALLTR